MSDLKNFLRIVAVTDRVAEDEQKRLIAMSKNKAIEGVSVDQQRSRVRVNCELLANGEIKPVYQMAQVSWFKISCSETQSEKCPRIGVVSEVGKLFPTPIDDYRSVVSFRNGTVVRVFTNRRLLADYVAVRKQGQGYFLIVDQRLDFLVPGYVQDREISGFLQGKVTADLLEISMDLLKKAVNNPEWVNGLQTLKEAGKPKPEADRPAPVKAEAPRDKKERRHECSDRQGPKPKAEAQEDAPRVKPGANSEDFKPED
jgi:hypothetical protein